MDFNITSIDIQWFGIFYGQLRSKKKGILGFYELSKKAKIDNVLLIIFLLLQVTLWQLYIKNIKVEFTITPVPPSKLSVMLMSFGDEQFMYRKLGRTIQDAGDDYGTTTPLKDYDYSKLQHWFYLLDELDYESNYVPSIAGFYYSSSQNIEDSRYVIEYLEKNADHDPIKKWQWYNTAVYLASYRLNDKDLAIRISEKLMKINDDSIPMWAKTAGIFLAAKKDHDICKAIELINLLGEDGLRKIENDKLLSVQGNQYNMFAHILYKRIQDIKKRPLAAMRCLKKLNKEKNK